MNNLEKELLEKKRKKDEKKTESELKAVNDQYLLLLLILSQSQAFVHIARLAVSKKQITKLQSSSNSSINDCLLD